jgi:uncharacterized Zn-binding protein involved in type VI secretion
MSSDTSGELEFAALHADDLLLDALGARQPFAASGSADDVVAGLLQAYAHEIDTRTGPLTGLLTDSAGGSAADYVPMPRPVPAMVPAPPVDEPVLVPAARRGNRAKFLVAHRAAAVVTVGSLVLGIGGVSAAVTGDGGPLDGIRRVVGSVTEQVTPHRSDADRISRTLSDAEAALAAADLRSARDLLEKARTDIEGVKDPTDFSSLRTNLIELRDRWHEAFDSDATPQAAPATQAEGSRLDPDVPGEGMLPDGKPGGLVGEGAGSEGPARGLPVGPESGITQTKDQIADRAEQKLEPLPDLPVDEIREPTWAPIIGEGGVLGGK